MPVLIVFFPLFAALLVGLNTRRMGSLPAQVITSGLVLASAAMSVLVLKEVMGGVSYHITLAEWIHSGGLKADWAIKVDPLSAVMLVVVTSVSALVHVYSIGYMSHDPHKQRFMAYLSLFTFFMLMLVTSDNFLQLFLGWEGVGLCSYLLIGFWFKKDSANAAAMKAFIVNRVGDFGFALGIMLVFVLTGSVEFDKVFMVAPFQRNTVIDIFGHPVNAVTLACLLLFIGAMGKSAQLGLHTWLPDAMEGPTPVSALIHAATMVTAGVFMVARCSPLFELSPDALSVVAVVGASTAIFAASVGLVQNDIKRVIAYSTCSQLGYMFFACGVSAYSAAMFHLMTHAFFKALLFLGAGSVIHAMSDEQDIRRMGGIWKKIPVTYALMWIGSLALAGVPFFAGYYSKDIILESAFARGTPASQYAFWLGCVAALFTAFYSWRLIILTFHGKPRASEEVMHHIHESPPVMLLPLFVLAAGAMLAGWFGAEIMGMVHPHGEFWAGAIKGGETVLEAAHHVPLWVKLAPLVAAVSGIALAYIMYMASPSWPRIIAGKCNRIYNFLLNKWYFDELYEKAVVKPVKDISEVFWKIIDAGVIDGAGVGGVVAVSKAAAGKISASQSGYIYAYAFFLMAGLAAFVTWFVVTARI